MAEDLERRLRAKLDEARRQIDINVEIAERDHPEGPIVDGKRSKGMLHSQSILATHVKDRLAEAEVLFAEALSTSRARVEALEKATTGWQPIASAPACDDFSIWFGWHKSQGLCQVSWGDNPRDMLFFRRIDHNDAEWKWTPSLSDFEAWMPLPVALTRQEEGNG